jgi:serine protease Do
MNGIVIRLAGVPQPETRIFHQELISIGTGQDCDLSFPADGYDLPASSALLTLRHSDSIYRIAEVNPAANVTRRGETVAVGEIIHDGDTFNFGETGIRLRLFALSAAMDLTESLELRTAVLADARHSGSVIKSSEKSPAAPRTDVALVFVKQLLRELVAEIPPRILYLLAGAALLVVGMIVYVGLLGFLEGRRNNAAIGDLKNSVSGLAQSVEKTAKELRETREENADLRSALSVAAKVVENYGPGVCLIYGTYSFIDPRSGREARFKEPSETNTSPLTSSGGINLSVDGNGRVYEIEFIGTGFLVAKGSVLTNRHVVQPWHDDPISSVLRAQGFRPKLKEIYAYFPKMQQPLTLRTLDVDQTNDLALCAFDQQVDLPVLPLDDHAESAVSGQLVVLIGYPAGIEGLLARVSGADRFRGHLSVKAVLNELASSNQIRPQSTQGHIGDIDSGRLIYDAQTGAGGSGGPVFGSNAKVIGINQAVLPDSPTNFGIPIRFGIELLNKNRQEQPTKSD